MPGRCFACDPPSFPTNHSSTANIEAFPLQSRALSQGHSIFYYDSGGKGPPLLLIHGLSSSHQIWQRMLPELQLHLRCIAVDLPGYGASLPMAEGFALHRAGALLLELMYQLGLNRFAVLGHSMGAQLAAIMALRYPNSVDQLLMAAPAGLETFTATQAAILRKSFRPDAIVKTSPMTIRKNLRYSFFRYPKVAEFMAEQRVALISDPEQLQRYALTVSQSVNAMLNEPVRDRLSELRQPTLVAFGKQDYLIPNRLFHPTGTPSRLAKRILPDLLNARLLLIPQCGHFLPFEKPGELNEAVIEFAG